MEFVQRTLEKFELLGVLPLVGDGVEARVICGLDNKAIETKAHFKCTGGRAHCSANCPAMNLTQDRAGSVGGSRMCSDDRGAYDSPLLRLNVLKSEVIHTVCLN